MNEDAGDTCGCSCCSNDDVAAAFAAQETRTIIINGQEVTLADLGPAKRAAYDQGYRNGGEDALRAIDAVSLDMPADDAACGCDSRLDALEARTGGNF